MVQGPICLVLIVMTMYDEKSDGPLIQTFNLETFS